MAVSRRRFVGGIAAALGYIGAGADTDLFAQQARAGVPGQGGRGPRPLVDLSKVAKINNNENPYGVPPAVRTAMDDPKAWEWANRYGAPDGGLSQAIQELHGVKAENIIFGCGSGELLSSRIFGPSRPSSMSTPATSRPMTFTAATAATR